MVNKTTIYLEDELRNELFDLSISKSKKTGKRIGMAEIIRFALIEYLRKKGREVHTYKSIINRMLSAKGSLGKEFYNRVQNVGKQMKSWKV